MAAFIGARVIGRGAAGEQAILMFCGISRQGGALGPIQAIFLFPAHGLPSCFRLCTAALKDFGRDPASTTWRRTDLIRSSKPIPGDIVRHSCYRRRRSRRPHRRRRLRADPKRYPEDFPGAIARHLAPGANPGAGAALHTALEGLTDIFPDRRQVSRRFTQGLGFQGGQKDGQRPVHQM